MKKVKKWLALVLTGLMTVSMLPGTALAAEIGNSQASLTVNQSKVAFAGHEWWVIGYNGKGVYSEENDGHITLLAVNLDEDLKHVPFRSGQGSAGDGYTAYRYGFTYYYANNPEGMEASTTPNEYPGSTLQQKMEEWASTFPEKEQGVIAERDFADSIDWDEWYWDRVPARLTDGILGQGVSGQKLWALSEEEWETINNREVRKYGWWWWLRSPSSESGYLSGQSLESGSKLDRASVDNTPGAARPALSLNLASVLFTSAAAGSGKSSATVEGNLVVAEAPTGTVKFTMKDSDQTLTVNATTDQSTQTGETLSFSYSGATTGENQYVSCILIDDSGEVKYYGKLADSSSAASGDISVPLDGVADGTYTLKIFSEQANGDLYTDFCSEPVSMKVDVTSGKGTVSDFGGTLLHEHSWSDEWQKDENHHWHECTVPDCPVTDNSQKDGYAEHTYDQKVASDEYLKSPANCDSPAVYYQSCVCGAFSKTAGTFTQGAPTGHRWGAPEWSWSADKKTATVKFTCKNDSTHTIQLQAKVESRVTPATCTKDGETVYTASVTFEGTLYTDSQRVPIAAGHTIIHVEAKEPTANESGNIEYWYCSKCGKYFSDEALTKEVQKADTVRPATGNSNTTAPAAAATTMTSIPQTGDESQPLVWVALVVLSGAALAGLAVYRKKRSDK